MPKVRVYSLKEKTGLSSNEILDILKKNNVEVKSNLSSVDEDIAMKYLNAKLNAKEIVKKADKDFDKVDNKKTSNNEVSKKEKLTKKQKKKGLSEDKNLKEEKNIVPSTKDDRKRKKKYEDGINKKSKIKSHYKIKEDVEIEKTKKFDVDNKVSNKNKKNKNKKKKGRNVIDENMRSVLEKKDLNFSKKSLKKKKKVKKVDDELLTDDMILESEKITVKERMTVGDFADVIEKPVNEIILHLMNLGVMAGINQYVDFDAMELIAKEYDIDIEVEDEKVEERILSYDFEDAEENTDKRAPVVTVMGHVDHGKTSLLDAIRSTGVAEREAGGITQHIGASEVIIHGEKIVFLDTPGHEAFTSLRARGVQVTDIAILVVAADDGVMPQTIEAIDHARAADVPIIVAINKIDKPNANPDRVIKELSENGVLVEEWGGDVVSVKVSAKNNENIDALLDMVILVSEMQELKANKNRNAIGTVIEAHLDKGKGPVATVLVQNGSLRIGDPFVCGTTYGRIRAMYNHIGKHTKKVGPSTPVEITGMSDVPMAGDRFFAIDTDKEAKSIAQERASDKKADELAKNSAKVTLEDIFDQIKSGNLKTLNLILKADVHGSIEAIKQSLAKLSNDEVKINIQHANIGAITESDIMLATASNTIVIGFNVRPSSSVIDMAKKEGVEIKTYRIIYELINDIEAALKGMLDAKFEEVQLGEVEVRQVFKVPGVGSIAGAYVISGYVQRKSDVRLLRNGVIIFEGKLSSLKRFKDDVKDVKQGYECGIGIEGYNDIKEGDIIEVFEMSEVEK
ncbi:MAG: translation initiation factor IF-2 [Clostridiales bacterium]|nr:MAG: translation initiation factor IF-2 [Clostridiales bacterium]